MRTHLFFEKRDERFSRFHKHENFCILTMRIFSNDCCLSKYGSSEYIITFLLSCLQSHEIPLTSSIPPNIKLLVTLQ